MLISCFWCNKNFQAVKSRRGTIDKVCPDCNKLLGYRVRKIKNKE